MNNKCKLRNHIKKIRLEKNMSQSELARRSGVSKSTISRIEKYQVIPNLLTLIKIYKAFGKDFELFGEVEEG